MKIAFVGKGGSGKTTLSSLFAQYVSQKMPATIFDADINVHIPELVGVTSPPSISSDEASSQIKKYLIGNNQRVASVDEMKKSTPPAIGSNIINFDEPNKSILGSFLSTKGLISVSVVGTYTKDKIGVSCYHNNLSVLENILSHSTAQNSVVIVDMVAGTDAYASTLHMQFDLFVVVVEPTKKGLDVYQKFYELARAANIEDRVRYAVNKSEDQEDVNFVVNKLGRDDLIAAFGRSKHIRLVDKGAEPLDHTRLSATEINSLGDILTELSKLSVDENIRLRSLWDLHKKYVAQGYVKARHGDLTHQIDPTFIYG